MGEMRVACEAGDITITWDPDDQEKTDKACAEFKQLREAGMEIYIEIEGRKPKRITAFDPKAARLIALPGVQRRKQAPKQSGGRQPRREKAMAGGPNSTLVLPARR